MGKYSHRRRKRALHNFTLHFFNPNYKDLLSNSASAESCTIVTLISWFYLMKLCINLRKASWKLWFLQCCLKWGLLLLLALTGFVLQGSVWQKEKKVQAEFADSWRLRERKDEAKALTGWCGGRGRRKVWQCSVLWNVQGCWVAGTGCWMGVVRKSKKGLAEQKDEIWQQYT